MSKSTFRMRWVNRKERREKWGFTIYDFGFTIFLIRKKIKSCPLRIKKIVNRKSKINETARQYSYVPPCCEWRGRTNWPWKAP